MIAIINYGMGNLRSVANSLHAIGHDAVIADEPESLRSASAIILPGVGAFGDGMANLRSRGFLPVMEEEVRRKGKPFLGVCLGMQLLASKSYEHGEHPGLGWIEGEVVRIPSGAENDGRRVPLIGWNDVRRVKPSHLYANVADPSTFYFVHSFHFQPDDEAVVTGVANYGPDLVASVEAGNIYGTQFHPEKSHKLGLALLRNFVDRIVGAE